MRKLSKISYLLLLLVFLGACEKDETSSAPFLKDNYRITEGIIYQDAIPAWKNVYEYSGEKISARYSYQQDIQGAWEPGSRRDYVYHGDDVAEISYIFDAGNWRPDNRTIKNYTNNRLTEHIYHIYTGAQWIPFWRSIFLYENTKMLEKIEYLYEGAAWQESFKEVYFYDGNNFQEMKEFDFIDDTWVQSGKTMFYYQGGQMKEYIEYSYLSDSGTWEREFRAYFTYTSTMPNSIAYYEFSGGAWIQTDIVSFNYYESGHLESYEWVGDNVANAEVFTYESGVGNYFTLYNDWLERKVFPSPTSPQGINILYRTFKAGSQH